MIVRERWCASLNIFLLITCCGSTTKMRMRWSTRCWTAGKWEHADGGHATEFCQRYEMGAPGWLLARRTRGEYDPCVGDDCYGCAWQPDRRGRCLCSSCADA